MTTQTSTTALNWKTALFQDFGSHSAVSIISSNNGLIKCQTLPTHEAAGRTPNHRAIFLDITADDKLVMMDAESKKISIEDTLPKDAFGIYYYPDNENNIMWATIDGDKKSGCDTLNCNPHSAPVIPIANEGILPKALKTICLGRGHHVVCPTPKTSDNSSAKVFVSNLLDGSMSILNYDKTSPQFLTLIDTLNLCQSEKENNEFEKLPNNAFPHGMAYSPLTKRVYCLNNGYANINVINPDTLKIESTIEMKISSNLLLSPNGRYLIGKGADRKSNPEHVLGRLCVVDVTTGNMNTILDLPDIYPSTYRFTPDGNKLYVTTAATGKGLQKENLKYDILQVYDTSTLPKLKLIKEIKVGQGDCSRRSIAFLSIDGINQWVFNPNPSDGTLTVLNAHTDEIVETLKVGEKNAKEVAFSYWNSCFYGA